MICCAHVITTSVSLVLIVAQPSYCPLVGKSAKPPLTLHLYPTLWLHPLTHPFRITSLNTSHVTIRSKIILCQSLAASTNILSPGIILSS